MNSIKLFFSTQFSTPRSIPMARVFYSILFFSCLIIAGCREKKVLNDYNSSLWYTHPAMYWNSQALHLGNGYFGASFFGGIAEETIALTDASMWTGAPAQGRWEKAGVNPKAKETIPLIREAVASGNGKIADKLISDHVFGSSELYGFFTSVGTLKITFPDQESSPSNYKRALDLKNSLGSVSYDNNEIRYNREYFCSYPDRVLSIKFTADKAEKISMNIGAIITQDSSSVEIKDNTYRVRGYINGNHRPFQVLVEINNEGGVIGKESELLTVRQANSVELYLTIATNYELKYPDYTGGDPEIISNEIMQKAVAKGYEALKKTHIEDYRTLYDRVNLAFVGNAEVEPLPTNERYELLKAGGSDPGYKTLAFNLGRYMIISSSRPNTLPANLQGVWNNFMFAPWAGNYQSNINIQEIYWSCGPTNLPECQQSYIDWIEDLAHSGREIAKRVYGTNGWVSHTTGNIWGHAAPIGSHPWGMYPMGAVWHCQHVWDQYAFTQDMDYLKKQAYPLLKDASIFWLENLFPYEGYLITAPTVSAEHGALLTEDGLNPAFHDFRSDKYVFSLPGVYQDIQMAWDIFTNTAEAATILGDDAFAQQLIETREKLLPLRIGQYGQLQEWYEDIDNPNCHHRHIAHLYAVAPGKQIHPTIDPEFADAAKKALDMRGDGLFMEQEVAAGGNWSRAHRMWSWTRLMDGNRANKILTEMLTEEGFENGLTFQHAPYGEEREDIMKDGDMFLHFQLDGSASVPGCIAEMLLQSHLKEIHLLPALPDELSSGKITGLKARGGYTVDMIWANGVIEHVTILCPPNKDVPPIRIKNDLVDPSELSYIEIVKQ